MHRNALLILISALLMMTPPVWAGLKRDISQLDLSKGSQRYTMGGLGFKTLFAPSSTGLLIGGYGLSLISESFYFGGGGFAGPILSDSTGSVGNLGYGGFIFGYQANFEKSALNVSLLFGGGSGGTSHTNSTAGLAVEPPIDYGIKVSTGMKITLGAGYLYFGRAPSLTGFTATLELRLKVFSLTFLED